MKDKQKNKETEKRVFPIHNKAKTEELYCHVILEK